MNRLEHYIIDCNYFHIINLPPTIDSCIDHSMLWEYITNIILSDMYDDF